MCIDTPMAITIKKTRTKRISTANITEHPIVAHNRAKVRAFPFSAIAFLSR